MGKNKINMIGIVFFTFIIGFLLTACSNEEAVILQAARETDIPILLPSYKVEGWSIDKAIYEDGLLAIRYVNESGERIELIHDQLIEGLEVLSLRNYLMTKEDIKKDRYGELIELEHFIGEMVVFDQPFLTYQYTFVKKQSLFASLDQIPIYQVIGKNTSFENFITFIKALKVTYS